MAKVEAGQDGALARHRGTLGGVVAEALRRGQLSAAARRLEFDGRHRRRLAHALGDESRSAQAIAAIIWYSARSD